MNRFLCIHAHFYQPPRENPWLEDIELQDSAYPYHDWNERITAQCYGPNTASRILDRDKRIIEIVNNYARISFDFGPTLLSWLEKHAPDVYRLVLEADRNGQKLFSGHGPAMAQAYNHMIMPLANRRDKRTQVVWGIKDFESRFGRSPEGMWLPETAVDLETLDILAWAGIKFTILAPHQGKRIRRIGRDEWEDVGGGRIDPKIPYLCKLPSGRAISLFFYDGPPSQEVAFAGLLNNGEVFAQRLLGLFDENGRHNQLAHIATDGETYGHHHRYGDMSLAFACHHIESNGLAKMAVYGEYLEMFPPEFEVEVIENTSWSCAHGVERWRSDCGCNSGMSQGWNQKWRRPLREAMDRLRDGMATLYEREASTYLNDPWETRDEYIDVILDRSVENIKQFLSRHASRDLSEREEIKILKLLEMQRNAMLMYTSCGWFFDDISGIETVQIMQYAGRAIQLAGEVGDTDLEPTFIKIIETAPSNVQEYENGKNVYDIFVKPSIVDLPRVAAHYALSSLFDGYPESADIYCYTATSEIYDRLEAGKLKLAIGKVHLRSKVTWEEGTMSFAALHLGDHNLSGCVRKVKGDGAFQSMHDELEDAFMKSEMLEVVRLMDKHFHHHNYSLWHLFRDEQRKIMEQLLETTMQEIDTSFRQIYEHHYPIIYAMNKMRIPLPKALASTVEFTLNTELRKLLEEGELNQTRLHRLISDISRWSFELDKVTLSFVANRRINKLIDSFSNEPDDLTLLKDLETLLRMLDPLPLGLNLWNAQNIYFSIGKALCRVKGEKADEGDEDAKEWLRLFDSLGRHMQVRIT